MIVFKTNWTAFLDPCLFSSCCLFQRVELSKQNLRLSSSTRKSNKKTCSNCLRIVSRQQQQQRKLQQLQLHQVRMLKHHRRQMPIKQMGPFKGNNMNKDAKRTSKKMTQAELPYRLLQTKSHQYRSTMKNCEHWLKIPNSKAWTRHQPNRDQATSRTISNRI